MRRLVVEFAAEDIARFLGESASWVKKIELLEVLNFLRTTPEETAMICRVKFHDPATKLEKGLHFKNVKVQLLEREKSGSYICFFKKIRPSDEPHITLIPGGYITTPYEIHDGKIKAAFLGTTTQLKKLLKMIERVGINCKVVSMMDAHFLPDSPLNQLTEKQRRVIVTAYHLGYYDLPKQISSKQLAMKLNMKSSTFVIHRIKAEKRLLTLLIDHRARQKRT
ncbi:MAG: helix-turn-helix domain-containing protein [Candidatus Bathyarchaeia archaeon]